MKKVNLKIVINGKTIDLDELENKIVVVGAAANAHALEDIKSTPVLPRHSGSDTVATFLDNMLHNEFARYSTFAQNVLIYSVIAIITFILILKFSLAVSAMSCACVFLIYFINYFLLINLLYKETKYIKIFNSFNTFLFLEDYT